MLKIIILPAALMGLLAVYAMVEESVERRLGRRVSPQALDKARQWMDFNNQQISRLYERQEAIEREINAAIDAKFDSIINRARMWLAWKISP